MDNPTTTPITDTASTQHSPDSVNEQKKDTPETEAPTKAVGGDQNSETTTSTVVKENKEIKAV